MSIRPRLGVEVPELTARVARASNPAGTTAMWVRDRLDGLWDDEDFAGWYPRDGRPGISPAQLATVSVLQFLLDLSDRDAAEAVRCRIDFKYALGLDLDDPGFHHTVLGDFRGRLLEDGRADRLLDLALARLKEAGLVRERTSQRTDSTHVLAAVRDLTRLELVTEAVRAALEELARTAGQALEGLVDEEWGRRYGRPVRLGKNPTRPKTRMNEAGADARRLLEHLAAGFPGLLRGPRVQALRQILVQNYHWDPAGRLRWRDDEGGGGLPPSAARIVSPYDPAARYARRGQVTRWTGYLAHVTEVGAADVRRWVVWLLGRYSEAYAYQQYRSLQQFFRWLAVEEDLPSPMAKLRPPKVTGKPVPFFSSVELSKLGRCCRGNSFEDRRDAAVLAVFLATGIRVSELAAIRYCRGDDPDHSDVDLEARAIKVRGKGGRDRIVKISHEAARRLDRYLRVRSRHELADRPELWLGAGNRGPLDRSGIYQLVVRRGQECGVRLYPHRFRHHFSHAWLDRGGAEGDLMELNGWVSPQMLTRYGASARGARARRSYDRVMNSLT